MEVWNVKMRNSHLASPASLLSDSVWAPPLAGHLLLVASSVDISLGLEHHIVFITLSNIALGWVLPLWMELLDIWKCMWSRSQIRLFYNASNLGLRLQTSTCFSYVYLQCQILINIKFIYMNFKTVIWSIPLHKLNILGWNKLIGSLFYVPV